MEQRVVGLEEDYLCISGSQDYIQSTIVINIILHKKTIKTLYHLDYSALLVAVIKSLVFFHMLKHGWKNKWSKNMILYTKLITSDVAILKNNFRG